MVKHVDNAIPMHPGIRRWSTLLLMVVLLGAAHGLFAQSVQGPAFGAVTSGALFILEEPTDGPMIEPAPLKTKIGNPFWGPKESYYLDDSFNKTPAAAPLGSNEISDRISGPAVAETPKTLASFQGALDAGSWIPPDPHMAVGPDHVIIGDNGRIWIYDKQGNLVRVLNDATWFANVNPVSGLGDNHFYYDTYVDRWVLLDWATDRANQRGYWYVSISDDSDPFGEWYNYAFPENLNGTTNAFQLGDYPKISFDHQAVYIAGRMFAYNSGPFYSKLRIINKAQLYAHNGGPVEYTDFWDFRDPNNAGSVVDGPPIAASHLDSTDNKTYVIADAPYFTSTFISLWTIDDPIGPSPTISGQNIPVAATQPPPDANQLGGGTPRIDSGRRAYRNAVYQDGQIWTATAIRGGTNFAYAYMRYLRIDVDNAQVLEDFSVGSDGTYYLYPAIHPTIDNDMVMVATRSTDTEYAGAAFTGRREGDPVGLGPVTVVKEGEGNYVKTFSGTRNRWGDYMGIQVDPRYPNVIWGATQYAATNNSWAIWVSAHTFEAYGLEGVVRDAGSGDAIPFVSMRSIEPSLAGITIDASTGEYFVSVPTDSVVLELSAFGYQDTVLTQFLTLNDTMTVDLQMEPEVQAAFAGQVRDAANGNGVEAVISFFAEGDPTGDPIRVAATDANGNYSVTTIIGTYRVEIDPVVPFAYTIADSIVLDAAGLARDFDLEIADVLLVDDDDGATYEDIYIESLDNISRSYNYWDVVNDGVPTAADMGLMPSGVVVWYTGDGAVTLTADEQAELLAHLNGGGGFLLSGINIAEQLDGTNLMNALGVGFAQDNSAVLVRGVAGSIYQGQIYVVSGGANDQSGKDQLTITNAATTGAAIAFGGSASTPIGVTFDNGSTKAVFLGFGVEGVGDAGRRDQLLDIALTWMDNLTGIDGPIADAGVPADYVLSQNYPNPFNPSTTIQFGLPQAGRVNLTVYNTLGQVVHRIADGDFQAGMHQVTWNGTDAAGNSVASGVYLYRLSVDGQFEQVRKLMLLK